MPTWGDSRRSSTPHLGWRSICPRQWWPAACAYLCAYTWSSASAIRTESEDSWKVESGGHDAALGKTGLNNDEQQLASTQYKYVKVANAGISTICPAWAQKLDKRSFKKFSHRCGPIDVGAETGDYTENVNTNNQANVEAHVGKLLTNLEEAHKHLTEDGDGPDVLYIFVAPEWAMRRYGKEEYPFDPRPLLGEDFQRIINRFTRFMHDSGRDFTHWLVVPGTVFWGLEVETEGAEISGDDSEMEVEEEKKFAMFNSAPIFYGGKLLWMENKREESDFLLPSEVWGKSDPNLSTKLAQKTDMEYFKKFVDLPPIRAVLISGLALGVDICKDHYNLDGRASARIEGVGTRKERLDIQLLLSSGATLFDPDLHLASQINSKSVVVRRKGVAIASDGGGLGPRLLVRKNSSAVNVAKFSVSDFEEKSFTREFNSWKTGCAENGTKIGGAQDAEFCRESQCKSRQTPQCEHQPGNFARFVIWGKIEVKVAENVQDTGALLTDDRIDRDRFVNVSV